jgi:hypothetical protein
VSDGHHVRLNFSIDRTAAESPRDRFGRQFGHFLQACRATRLDLVAKWRALTVRHCCVVSAGGAAAIGQPGDAEVFPLVKTGGLADVLGALPQALVAQGTDVRLVLPGLPAIVQGVEQQRLVCEIGPMFGAARISLRLGVVPFSGVPAYVIDAPHLYQRAGNPYLDASGAEWSDNLQRFGLLGWVAAHLASGELDAGWLAA